MSQQQTIAKEIELSGKGLFKGQLSKVRFKPAQPDTGIVFLCTKDENLLQGAYDARFNIRATTQASTLRAPSFFKTMRVREEETLQIQEESGYAFST